MIKNKPSWEVEFTKLSTIKTASDVLKMPVVASFKAIYADSFNEAEQEGRKFLNGEDWVCTLMRSRYIR